MIIADLRGKKKKSKDGDGKDFGKDEDNGKIGSWLVYDIVNEKRNRVGKNTDCGDTSKAENEFGVEDRANIDPQNQAHDQIETTDKDSTCNEQALVNDADDNSLIRVVFDDRAQRGTWLWDRQYLISIRQEYGNEYQGDQEG